jgi:hypothetical protein
VTGVCERSDEASCVIEGRGFFEQLRNNKHVRKLEHFVVLVWSYACKCRSWEISHCLSPAQVKKNSCNIDCTI